MRSMPSNSCRNNFHNIPKYLYAHKLCTYLKTHGSISQTYLRSSEINVGYKTPRKKNTFISRHFWPKKAWISDFRFSLSANGGFRFHWDDTYKSILLSAVKFRTRTEHQTKIYPRIVHASMKLKVTCFSSLFSQIFYIKKTTNRAHADRLNWIETCGLKEMQWRNVKKRRKKRVKYPAM